MVLHPLLTKQTAFTLVYKLFAAVFFAGVILALFQRKKSRAAALVLGVPSIISLFTSHLIPNDSPIPPSVFFHAFPAVFLMYTVFVILKGIFKEFEVTLDGINGAFCGYLLLGLVFGHLYCLAEAYRPNSFTLDTRIGTLPSDEHHRHFLLTYFSLITLTTVGYGDVIPSSPPARTLAWLEAVIGQFYVAVIVAQLIALNVSSAMRRRGLD